jgi:hypothetical protein
MNKYILSNGMEEIIRIFDSEADLHRWINATYPNTDGVNNRGRKLVVDKVLPSMFRIAKIRSDRLGI